MPLKILSIIFLLAVTQISFSQDRLTEYNFKSVDSFARFVKYDNDLSKLTNTLTAPYTDSIYKLRAIFIWITDNIEYDYKFLTKGGQAGFSCTGTKEICDAAKINYENNFVQNCLENRKGICSGYAYLFKRMCGSTGINSDVVDGYVKVNPYQVGLLLNVSHSWNVVTVDGKNYFFDLTWASGSCKADENGKPTAFVKYYEDYYWMLPYDKIARNHYPNNEKWIAPGMPYNKEVFFNNPFFYSAKVLSNIAVSNPESGVLTTHIGDTVRFKFSYRDKINRITINTNTKKNIEVLTTSPSSGWPNNFQFDYVVTENFLYYIDIFFDGQPALRYKVKS